MSGTANQLFTMTRDLLDSYEGIRVLSASPEVLAEGDFGFFLTVEENFLEQWFKIINAVIQSNPDPTAMAIGFQEELQNLRRERQRTFFLRMAFRNDRADDPVKAIFFKN